MGSQSPFINYFLLWLSNNATRLKKVFESIGAAAHKPSQPKPKLDFWKMCWSCLSTVSWRRLKVILFLDTNMLFHPKLMFCDESATQLFLVTCTRLYTSLCWSVGWSVNTSCFWAFRAKRRADFSYYPCPAPILPLPTRTQLMLPYIRTCSAN